MIAAAAMNQNEGWHKTGNIAQMHSALKCEEKLQNLIVVAQFGRLLAFYKTKNIFNEGR